MFDCIRLFLGLFSPVLRPVLSPRLSLTCVLVASSAIATGVPQVAQQNRDAPLVRMHIFTRRTQAPTSISALVELSPLVLISLLPFSVDSSSFPSAPTIPSRI